MKCLVHLVLVLVFLLVAMVACEPASPATPSPAVTAAPSRTPALLPAASRPPKRVLAIATTPPLDPAPAERDSSDALGRAYDLTYGAGVRGGIISSTWRELEPSAKNFSLDETGQALNNLGNMRGLELFVGLAVLNTTVKETPPDLVHVPLDSAQMKQRFHAFFDALRPHLNDHVKYLSIGNEVDVYLAAHPKEWDAYQSFYVDAVAYVHSVAPRLQVGVTTTFTGAVGAQARHIAQLNKSSDIVIFTYYPIDERFIPRDPDAPMADMPRMVALAAGKPVILQEVGYPSSATLKSSEEKQAQFVANVFSAWKSIDGSIPFLSFYMLHDMTPERSGNLAKYYGLSGQATNLQAYLCSLGLRHANGAPKPAWQSLVDGAAATGRPSGTFYAFSASL